MLNGHLDALRAIGDPIERLVTALVRVGPPDFGETDKRDTFVERAWTTIYEELYPGRELTRRQPWDEDEVARWFAARAAVAELPTDCLADWTVWKRPLIGKSRTHTVKKAAWRLRAANMSGTEDVYFFADGSFSPSPANAYRYKDGTISDNDMFNHFGFRAFRKMAELFGIS